MKIGSGILLNNGGINTPALGFISRPELGFGQRNNNLEFYDGGVILASIGLAGFTINRKLSISHNPVSGGVLTSNAVGEAEWKKRLESGTLNINKYMEYKDFEIPIKFSGFISLPNILYSCPLPISIKNKTISGFSAFPNLFKDYKIQTETFDVVEFKGELGICYLDPVTESLRFVIGDNSSAIDIDCLASFSVLAGDILSVLYISFSEGNEEWRYATSADGINWTATVIDTASTPLGFLPNFVKLVSHMGEIKAVYMRENGNIIVREIGGEAKVIENAELLAAEGGNVLNILVKNSAGNLELFADFEGSEFDFTPNTGKSSSDIFGGNIVSTEADTNKIFYLAGENEKKELGTSTTSGYPKFMGGYIIYNKRNSAPSEKQLVNLSTGQDNKILQHMNFYSEHLPLRRGDHYEIFFLSAGNLYSVKYFEGAELSWLATL